MTPKMVKALEAALNCDDVGGLSWDGSRWTSYGFDQHGPITVSDLTFAGFLERRGKTARGPDARRVITEAGRQHLRDRREVRRKP